MTFSLSPDQEKKIGAFVAAEFGKIRRRQMAECEACKSSKKCFVHSSGGMFTGASGGGVTYHFTPTSLGTVVVVDVLGAKLDVSDYEDW